MLFVEKHWNVTTVLSPIVAYKLLFQLVAFLEGSLRLWYGFSLPLLSVILGGGLDRLLTAALIKAMQTALRNQYRETCFQVLALRSCHASTKTKIFVFC
jgi:hypothetical protein